jgi:mannose/cellobiose epimerase-like protein (N-acyl-D-glucosamine 2-epimerase family)
MAQARAARAARELHAQLHGWLVHAAYPLWARGGFHERLTVGGPVCADARRQRVQARQVCALANGVGVRVGARRSQASIHSWPTESSS